MHRAAHSRQGGFSDRSEVIRAATTARHAQDPGKDEQVAVFLMPILNSVLHKRLRSPELIEDIRQETILRVIMCIRDGRICQLDRLVAFAIGVCNRVLCEHLRTEKRYLAVEDRQLDTTDNRTDVARTLLDKERSRLVDKVLALLTFSDRQLLRMIFYADLSRTDICSKLRVSPSNLRVMLHRAKSRFREAASGESQAPARRTKSDGARAVHKQVFNPAS